MGHAKQPAQYAFSYERTVNDCVSHEAPQDFCLRICGLSGTEQSKLARGS
jgi:hypothetical protein